MTEEEQEFEKAVKGLTSAQVDALNVIAFGGEDWMVKRATAQSLIKRGLVEADTQLVKSPGQLDLHITRYEMPIRMHIRWCHWAAQREAERQKAAQ